MNKDNENLLKKNGCKITGNEKSKIDIHLLQGFISNKNTLDSFAKKFSKNYRIIQCDSIGFGKNRKKGKISEWDKEIEIRDKLINEIGKDVILIGESKGSVIALNLLNKNKKIKQIFIAGAPNGNTMMDEPYEKAKVFLKYAPLGVYNDINNLMYIFPENVNKCKKSNRKKIYLIHNKRDKTIPESQFYKNKEQLCLPEENTLLFDKKKINLFYYDRSHIGLLKNKESIDFIKKNIKK